MSGYLREVIGPFFLFGLIMVLVVAYGCLLILCTYQSSLLFIVTKKEDFNRIEEQKLYDILGNMSKDQHHCFHCIEQHGGSTSLQELIRQQETYAERDEILRSIRTVFNILSMINSIVVLVIFGGPKLISFLMLFSCLCVFGSIYVRNVHDAILFESAVICSSLIILLKSVYVIIVEIIRLDRRKASWEYSLILISDLSDLDFFLQILDGKHSMSTNPSCSENLF